MRPYETLVVLDPQLEEGPINKEIEHIEHIISSHKGELQNTDRWGTRKLSFDIGKRQQGFYALIRFNATPELPLELDRQLRLNERVLRHIIRRTKPHNLIESDKEVESLNEDNESV